MNDSHITKYIYKINKSHFNIFLYVCYLQNKQSIPHVQAENKNFPQL